MRRKLFALFVLISVSLKAQFAPTASTSQFNNHHQDQPLESAFLWSNESFASFHLEKEVFEKREANSKTFRNPDGSFTSVLFAGDIHYYENGTWKTIFHTITPSNSGFQNLTNLHKTTYPSTSSGSIKTDLPNGASMTDMMDMKMYYEVNGMSVQTQSIASKQGMVQRNELTYSNVYGTGVHLRLTQNTSNRKMDYIIQDATALSSIPSGAQYMVFEEKVMLPAGWSAQLLNNEILLKDANGTIKAKYEKPEYHDTHIHLPGEEDGHGGCRVEGIYAIVLNGSILTIKTKVPVSWLTSNERVFPLVIDPTINLYPNNSARWTGSHETSSSPVNYSSTNIYTSLDGDFRIGRHHIQYVNNGWVKYNVSTIPKEACITTASFAYYITANSTSQSGCSVPTRFRHMAADPSVNAFDNNGVNNQARLADIRDGHIYGDHNLAIYASGNGWQTWSLTANLNYLTAQLTQGWFAIGLDVYGGNSSHSTCENNIAGYSHTDKPYMVVDYMLPPPAISGNNVLCVGQTSQISNGGGTWASSNTAVATVNASGLVTAVGPGVATISSTISGFCNPAVTTIIVSNNDMSGVVLKNDPSSCSPQNGSVSAFIQEGNFKGTSQWYRNTFSSATPEIGTSYTGGNAVLNSNTMLLTPNSNSQYGILGISNPSGLNASSVAASFDLFIGGGNGADGFYFYYGNGANNIKVRFDTWNNGAGTSPCEAQNNSGDGVSVSLSQGAGAGGHDHAIVTGGCHQYLNIRNSWQHVFFHVDIAGRVYLKVGSTVVFNYVPLANQAAYEAQDKSSWEWKFEAHTGGANDEHRIDNLHITAFNQYQYQLNNGAWQNGNTFSNVGSGTHVVDARPKLNGACTEGTVGTIRMPAAPTVTISPSPASVCIGDNLTLTATLTPPSSGTLYALAFPSAYGAGWHGIQEIRGRAGSVLQTLSCVTASSATYTSNICGDANYGSGNAFDGSLPGAASGVQWLTPKEAVISDGAGINTNWRNYGTYAPFYSPEYIVFSSPTPLTEIEIRNGRYASGSSSTCFNDYHLMVSNDGGASWTKIKQGQLQNDQGVDQVITILPATNNYVWKKGATVVGTGPTLTFTGITAAQAGTYTLEVGYDMCNKTTQTVNVIVSTSSTAPATISGGGNYCHGNNITLNTTGGTIGTDATHVWYKGGCNNAFTETWTNQNYTLINTSVVSHNNGILRLTPVPVDYGGGPVADPMIHMPNLGSFDPTVYRYLNIRYRVVSGTALAVEAFFYNAHYPSAHGEHHTWSPLVSDGNWHIATIDMHQNSHYLADGSNITGWRYDWATGLGAIVDLDFIQLSQYPMIDENNTTSQLEWTSAHPYFPQSGTTTYASARIDNCGATSCISTTVTLPNAGTALALNNEAATCVVNANETVHFYNTTSGRYITSVSANATALGSTTATVYVDGTNQLSYEGCNPVNLATAVMQRHWVITPTTNGTATVRLPYTATELATLTTAANASSSPHDAVGGQADLRLSKYSGGTFPASTNVNANVNDNCVGYGGVGGTTIHTLTNGTNPVAGITSLYSDAAIPGFSEFWLHGGVPTSPLAVSLSNFSSNCEDKATTISWTTVSETNSDYYVVERSRDGETWSELAIVDGAGTTTAINQYEVSDKQLGTVYYRLKQVDKDGKTEVFGPIYSNCESKENSLSIYPNPTSGAFTVALTATENMGESTVVLQDMNGKIIAERTTSIVSGVNMVFFDNMNLMRGAYLISVKGKDTKSFLPARLIVQ